MGAFEMREAALRSEPARAESMCGPDPRRVREECIIAMKVYDSCRHQDCLTPSEIGPARAAECVDICGEIQREGDIIRPPANAATVTIDNLRIKRIIIVDKQPCPFRQGYWDVDIKFVFDYRLTFREVDGCIITCIRANSIFNMKQSLFGSVGSELSIGTDLLRSINDTPTFEAEPFIWVEARAVALHAKIHRRHHHPPHRDCNEVVVVEEDELLRGPNEVLVTIGLFSIVKLFRIVDLTVESKGFCIPDECEDISPINPCDYFDDLDFPMDIFAPPQRPEFMAGVSSNIPKDARSKC
ncbi:MAG: hypothetical protein LBR83_04450 [Clostridiales bacterium]|jgi:hypothetical protein|nr:hypothetical protein [Clostridiales bacterium]